MKIFVLSLIFLLPLPAVAQNFQNMNQEDMQKMMQQMQKVQQCMEAVDQQKLAELQIRAEKTVGDIDSLCAQGKKDQAQQMAISFGKEMAEDPTMKQMKKCGEMAEGALPDMAGMFDESKLSGGHVCDQP
jgi:competence protein ComGC